VFQNNKLIYIPVKGHHLVPVIVPHNTVKTLKLLADPSVREYSSALHHNCHLFTSTYLSEDNSDGWHAVQRVCSKVAIPVRNINATKVHHHVSTLYAAQDVPEQQRQYFYSHTRHSATTNTTDTQLPQILTSTLDNCNEHKMMQQIFSSYVNTNSMTVNRGAVRRKQNKRKDWT